MFLIDLNDGKVRLRDPLLDVAFEGFELAGARGSGSLMVDFLLAPSADGLFVDPHLLGDLGAGEAFGGEFADLAILRVVDHGWAGSRMRSCRLRVQLARWRESALSGSRLSSW